MEDLLKELLVKMEKIDERFDKLENEMQLGFKEMHGRFDRIEKKLGSIPSTYEENEKLLGGALRDIELLKKIILNQ